MHVGNIACGLAAQLPNRDFDNAHNWTFFEMDYHGLCRSAGDPPLFAVWQVRIHYLLSSSPHCN
jgi:hypothetical protein